MKNHLGNSSGISVVFFVWCAQIRPASLRLSMICWIYFGLSLWWSNIEYWKIWHPCFSPTMESNITPCKEGDNWHEIHGAGPFLNPYGGYKDALVRKLDIVARSSETIAMLSGDSRHWNPLLAIVSSSGSPVTMTSRIEQSWLGSALPSRWNLECRSGVLCCLQHSTTRQLCPTDTGRKFATHSKQVASSSKDKEGFT